MTRGSAAEAADSSDLDSDRFYITQQSPMFSMHTELCS